MNKIHATIIALLCLLCAVPAQAAPDARSIMEQVNAQPEGTNRSADMQMVLIDKFGVERNRFIKVFSRDSGQETQRIMFFMEPDNVKGTAFLTYDYAETKREDDQWLFLPALHKTKRIASTDRGDSFMGSDFTFADLTKKALDDYNFELLKEDSVDGHPVWLIQSTPKSVQISERDGYAKSVLFVRQDNYVTVRAVNWLRGSDDLKYMDVRELKKLDGIWVPVEIHMSTKRDRKTIHKTVLKYSDIRFDAQLSKDFFSVRQMEKGL